VKPGYRKSYIKETDASIIKPHAGRLSRLSLLFLYLLKQPGAKLDFMFFSLLLIAKNLHVSIVNIYRM